MNVVSLADALGAVLLAQEKHAQIATNPKGFFVHVRVPPHIADRLREVQKTLLPADDVPQDIDHVTLVYTQKALEDHPPEKVHAALTTMRQHGEKTEPIDAKIQGWAYFDSASKDGKPATALVALVDAPGLEHLHVDLSRALEGHGIQPSDNHIFTPHITLGYLPQHGRVEKTLPPINGHFEIGAVHVAARDHHEIPLTGFVKTLGQKAASFALRPALYGAGIGASIGALGGLLSANPQDAPLHQRMLTPALIGALGGGIAGGAHALGGPVQPASYSDLGQEAAMEALKR